MKLASKKYLYLLNDLTNLLLSKDKARQQEKYQQLLYVLQLVVVLLIISIILNIYFYVSR